MVLWYRAGESCVEALAHLGGALTLAGGVTEVAAGAGATGSDEPEVRRHDHRPRRPHDVHLLLVVCLQCHLDDVPAELRDLVEHEHAVVGQAQLTGSEAGASDHAGRRDGVVRRPQGAARAAGLTPGGDKPRRCADAGQVPLLLHGHVGQQASGAGCEHRLATAGVADQEHGRLGLSGPRELTDGIVLTSHLGEVQVTQTCPARQGRHPGRELLVVRLDADVVFGQQLDRIGQGGDPPRPSTVRMDGRGALVVGDHDLVEVGQPSHDGLGRRPELALEAELTHHDDVVGDGRAPPVGDEDADGDGQVTTSAALPQLDGCDVDHDTQPGEVVAARRHGRAHSLGHLSRCVGWQADGDEAGQPADEADLDLDGDGVDPDGGGGDDGGDGGVHACSLASSARRMSLSSRLAWTFSIRR